MRLTCPLCGPRDVREFHYKGSAVLMARPEAEAGPFSLPQLPVSVEVRNVQVDRFAFGEPVFGQAADIALSGAVTLADGVLDSRLDVRRLDGPGGTLGLKAAFSNATRVLDLPGARVVGQQGWVVTPDHGVAVSLSWYESVLRRPICW